MEPLTSFARPIESQTQQKAADMIRRGLVALISLIYIGSSVGLSILNGRCRQRTLSRLRVSSFAQYEHFPQWLKSSCKHSGYENPTEVQALSLPVRHCDTCSIQFCSLVQLKVILSGRDVALQAQTGSGKTLAFALPLLAKLDANRAAIQAVVVVPTRELGLQVSGVLKQLASTSPTPISVMTVVDGSKNRR